jgi:ATP-dependent Lon protease
MPEENRVDYEGLSDDVVEGITCHFVPHFDSVYPRLFSDQSPAALVSGW